MVLSFNGLPPTKQDIDYSKLSIDSDTMAKEYIDKIDGRIILITGVSPNGIGAATALSFSLGSPKLLILAGRDSSKVNKTVEDCKAVNPSVPIRTLELDLASLKQVTAAAKSLSDLPAIDILINNAGIMAPPYSLSVDGFESQWATNHLGHFQLTRILLPQLLASKDGGVVVNLCSQGHRMYGINWDDVNLESEPHSGDTFWPGYGQSKTANILHALALKKRVHKAFSVNPGAVNSNLTKENTYADIDSLIKEWDTTWEELKTPKQGASTIIWAALDPSISDDVVYLEHNVESGPAEHACGPEDAERLWKLSEELIDSKI